MYFVNKAMILSARNSYARYKMSKQTDAIKLAEQKKNQIELKRKRDELAEKETERKKLRQQLHALESEIYSLKK